MKKSGSAPKPTTPKTGKKQGPELPGYPIYPPGEDVFSQWNNVRETAIGAPEINLPGLTEGALINLPGDELDVPGAEFDDAQERIGSEDEENNYYSIGGERHDDLEENKGDSV